MNPRARTMKEGISIALHSQSGKRLKLNREPLTVEYLLSPEKDSRYRSSNGESSPLLHEKSISDNRQRAYSLKQRSRLGPFVEFFDEMTSFEKVTLVLIVKGEGKHIITMSSQATILRLLPFLINGRLNNLTELQSINFSLDTHPFLKIGWIQQTLKSILVDELVHRDHSSSLEHVIQSIKINFGQMLETLYSLHTSIISLKSPCIPLCNALATGIMSVEYILLNPEEVLKRMSSMTSLTGIRGEWDSAEQRTPEIFENFRVL